MDIRFEAPDLCRTCNHRAAMEREWGHRGAAAIGQHLQELEAVASLADMVQLPHVRLTHDRVDGRAWVEGTSGVRIGLRWDTSEQSGDPEESWGNVTEIVVETIVVDGGEGHG